MILHPQPASERVMNFPIKPHLHKAGPIIWRLRNLQTMSKPRFYDHFISLHPDVLGPATELAPHSSESHTSTKKGQPSAAEAGDFQTMSMPRFSITFNQYPQTASERVTNFPKTTPPKGSNNSAPEKSQQVLIFQPTPFPRSCDVRELTSVQPAAFSSAFTRS